MASVTVKRGGGYIDAIRAYKIVLDGQVVGAVSRNGELTVQAPAGPHEIHAAVDWCSSNRVTFSLADSEAKTFECGNNTKLFTQLFTVLFHRSQYLWMRAA
jgi:hypothetical protein